MLKKLNFDNSTQKYWMELTEPELELIASICAMIRLGTGTPHSQATFDLLEGISQLKGDDYCLDALGCVAPEFSVTDDNDNPLIHIDPSANLMIEV